MGPIPSEGAQKSNTSDLLWAACGTPHTQEQGVFSSSLCFIHSAEIKGVLFAVVWLGVLPLEFISLINSLPVWCHALSSCWRHQGKHRFGTKGWAMSLPSSEMCRGSVQCSSCWDAFSWPPWRMWPGFLHPFPLACWPFISQPASGGTEQLLRGVWSGFFSPSHKSFAIQSFLWAGTGWPPYPINLTVSALQFSSFYYSPSQLWRWKTISVQELFWCSLFCLGDGKWESL